MQPRLKGRQHYDEKYVKVKGEDAYDLNCKDSKTRYIGAHLLVEKRTLQACVRFLKQLKSNCYEQMLAIYRREKRKPARERRLVTFVFDGFSNYKRAWSKLFYRVTKCIAGVPIACKKHGLKHNNNPVENYNGGLKSRLKVMRGGFRSWGGAEAFLELKRPIYNFANPQQNLRGKTPAEVAEIKLKLGRNKLLGLIRYAARISR